MVTPFTKIAIIAVAAGVLAAGTVYAQNPIVQEQRKDRVQETKQHIDQDYREGNVTRGEAHDLTLDNREIAHDAGQQVHDGGGLSRGEQRDINQQQNTLNRDITRQSQQ
jgi:hypothetical protein